MKQDKISTNTVSYSIREWRQQQRAMRKQAQEIIRRDKWKYDNIKKHRNWIRTSRLKPIKIYTMDKLQNTIITKYEELDKTEQVKYLKESIEWHRQVAHYHMYMERNFATQLADHPGEKPTKNKAKSATSLAKPDEADSQLAVATEAE
jgi:hypothetical protein